MTPLHPSQSRCQPINSGQECDNCKRFADHPQQTPGRTYWQTAGPNDPMCAYVATEEIINQARRAA